jgi:hypothetical protein
MVGCGWRVTPPLRPEQFIRPKKLADDVVLQVNDTAVSWGDNHLGDIVRDTLVASGTFSQVYFPVEPSNPPALRLMIQARGGQEDRFSAGLLAVTFSPLFPFLYLLWPTGAMPFRVSFDLDATVVLFNGSQELRRSHITTLTRVSHAPFCDPREFKDAVRGAAFTDLGERIASDLSALHLRP